MYSSKRKGMRNMGEKLSLRRRVYNGTMTVLVRLGAVMVPL